MPKFLKEPDELDSILDKWLYVFKHLHELDKMPTTVQEAVFLKLFKQCEIANYSPKEAMKYKESWKVYNDNKNVMDFAIAKAEKLAEERGLNRGIEQERQVNEQKQKEQALRFATLMLKNSAMTDAEIAQATQLTVQEVAKLRIS